MPLLGCAARVTVDLRALLSSWAVLLDGYAPLEGTYDELFSSRGEARPEFRRALETLAARDPDEHARAQALAEIALLNQGVTFSVYADQRGAEKIFPFCLIPRIIS